MSGDVFGRNYVHTSRYAARVLWTGAEIKRRRVEKGWSQQQLADALGASRRAVIAWEAGDSIPQGRFIGQMERVFGNDTSSPESVGLLLRDADFAATVNHLIDLHNTALRGQVHEVFSVENAVLPSTLREGHDITEGPPVTRPDDEGADEQGEASRQRGD